jgi:hypothetical protein
VINVADVSSLNGSIVFLTMRVKSKMQRLNELVLIALCVAISASWLYDQLKKLGRFVLMIVAISATGLAVLLTVFSDSLPVITAKEFHITIPLPNIINPELTTYAVVTHTSVSTAILMTAFVMVPAALHQYSQREAWEDFYEYGAWENPITARMYFSPFEPMVLYPVLSLMYKQQVLDTGPSYAGYFTFVLLVAQIIRTLFFDNEAYLRFLMPIIGTGLFIAFLI